MALKKNLEFHLVIISLIFNMASMLSITNMFSNFSVNSLPPVQEILFEFPQLLIAFAMLFAPWGIAIYWSQSKNKVLSVFFAIISVISCSMIVGFNYSGPSEGVGYCIVTQIISAWFTLFICSFFDNKQDIDRI